MSMAVHASRMRLGGPWCCSLCQIGHAARWHSLPGKEVVHIASAHTAAGLLSLLGRASHYNSYTRDSPILGILVWPLVVRLAVQRAGACVVGRGIHPSDLLSCSTSLYAHKLRKQLAIFTAHKVLVRSCESSSGQRKCLVESEPAITCGHVATKLIRRSFYSCQKQQAEALPKCRLLSQIRLLQNGACSHHPMSL